MKVKMALKNNKYFNISTDQNYENVTVLNKRVRVIS